MSAMNCLPSLPLIGTLIFAGLTASAFGGSDLDEHLRDGYEGKTFVLRGFYADDKLHFDATGAPIGKPRHGDWTSDGFVTVTKIHVSGQHIVLNAKRKIVVENRVADSLLLRDLVTGIFENKRPIPLKIEADLEVQNPSFEAVDAEISKIFLTTQDAFAEQIPPYWRPCILAQLGSKGSNCQLSPEMLAVPGLNPLIKSDASTPQMEDTSGSPVLKIEKVEKGITPPRALVMPDPPFTERARQARIQGTVMLSLVVDKEGHPARIHILRPIGCGLDDVAVRTVAGWKFAPARKDGQNVPVEIAIEVDFHLY